MRVPVGRRALNAWTGCMRRPQLRAVLPMQNLKTTYWERSASIPYSSRASHKSCRTRLSLGRFRLRMRTQQKILQPSCVRIHCLQSSSTKKHCASGCSKIPRACGNCRLVREPSVVRVFMVKMTTTAKNAIVVTVSTDAEKGRSGTIERTGLIVTVTRAIALTATIAIIHTTGTHTAVRHHHAGSAPRWMMLLERPVLQR